MSTRRLYTRAHYCRRHSTRGPPIKEGGGRRDGCREQADGGCVGGAEKDKRSSPVFSLIRH